MLYSAKALRCMGVLRCIGGPQGFHIHRKLTAEYKLLKYIDILHTPQIMCVIGAAPATSPI